MKVCSKGSSSWLIIHQAFAKQLRILFSLRQKCFHKEWWHYLWYLLERNLRCKRCSYRYLLSLGPRVREHHLQDRRLVSKGHMYLSWIRHNIFHDLESCLWNWMYRCYIYESYKFQRPLESSKLFHHKNLSHLGKHKMFHHFKESALYCIRHIPCQ